jgi:threonine dehydratase
VASTWPLSFQHVLDAGERIRRFLPPTPLRSYGALDAAVGHGIRVLVKHENHQPTNAFKIRNNLAVLTALGEDERRRGVVTATRGNHGLGLAWAGAALGVPVTCCVPRANNPEKNEGMQVLGATLVEHGRDYDDALEKAEQLVSERGLRLVHPTNDRQVIAGAGTIALEILGGPEPRATPPRIDALVVAVGGGSQAVGALTVARTVRPDLPVYGVQAAGASAIHDAWHARRPIARSSADTIADGLATRKVYEMTFGALLEGLAGFVKVPDSAIAEAVRLYLRTTHNLAEGAGAAGLAGLLALRETLAGKTVGVILSGGNIDQATLRRIVNGEV